MRFAAPILLVWLLTATVPAQAALGEDVEQAAGDALVALGDAAALGQEKFGHALNDAVNESAGVRGAADEVVRVAATAIAQELSVVDGFSPCDLECTSWVPTYLIQVAISDAVFLKDGEEAVVVGLVQALPDHAAIGDPGVVLALVRQSSDEAVAAPVAFGAKMSGRLLEPLGDAPVAAALWEDLRFVCGREVCSVLLPPGECVEAATACASEILAMELTACLGCCVPCSPISTVVFLKEGGEGAVFSAIGAAVDEASGLPGASPDPGSVTVPLVAFGEGAPPVMAAYAEEVASVAGTTAAVAVNRVVVVVAHIVANQVLERMACLIELWYCGVPVFQAMALVQIVVDKAADTNNAAETGVFSAKAAAEEAADQLPGAIGTCQALDCGETWGSEAASAINGVVGPTAERLAEHLSLVQGCLSSDDICGVSLLQFTVLIQVVVSNAVYMKEAADSAAFESLDEAMQGDGNATAVAAPPLAFATVVVPMVAEDKVRALEAFVNTVIEA